MATHACRKGSCLLYTEHAWIGYSLEDKRARSAGLRYIDVELLVHVFKIFNEIIIFKMSTAANVIDLGHPSISAPSPVGQVILPKNFPISSLPPAPQYIAAISIMKIDGIHNPDAAE